MPRLTGVYADQPIEFDPIVNLESERGLIQIQSALQIRDAGWASSRRAEMNWRRMIRSE